MDQSRNSSRSSTRSPKTFYHLQADASRDFNAMAQLGRQEPSLFSSMQNRPNAAAAASISRQPRTSPFKQAVQGSRLQVKSKDRIENDKLPAHPGETLMARTEQSVDQVRQQILEEAVSAVDDKYGKKRGGRLVKGHLQPMRTFRVTGPPIQACCGILPQKAINTFGVTASVKRRGLIIANLDTTRQMYDTLVGQYAALANQQHRRDSSSSGNRRHYRPDTSESIHRTSIASDEELEAAAAGRGSVGSGSDQWEMQEEEEIYGEDDKVEAELRLE